ncbi:MAG TPA: alpha/beta hydrolase [Dehalococcoidia bacterium]|nr:alpha/beta hydrolase [Dehalococcoidia bacterium]
MSSGAPDYGLIDRVGLGRSVFFPRPDATQPPDGATDFEIPVGNGITVAARMYKTDPGAPTFMHFHGNGEVVADHDGIALMYREMGLNLVVVDFRGYGVGRGVPTFAALVGDARPAAAEFHARLDAARIVGPRIVMGRSLGAHPALEIAARCSERFCGLVIESGAASLRRLVAVPDVGEQAHTLVTTHEEKIRGIRLPTLLLHGEYDEIGAA